jgi:hypothetical protein
MADKQLKKLRGTLDPLLREFMQANPPEELGEEFGPTLIDEIPNYMVQEILAQVVDLLVEDLTAQGKIKV